MGYCGSLVDRNDRVGDVYNVTDLYRDSVIPELNFNVINFDHIGSAFLTIFQCITMEGWTNVMYIYQDAFDYYFVTSYFITCIIICSFFLLNLTIAVMLMEYEKLDKDDSSASHKLQLKEIAVKSKLPKSLVDFIIREGNLQVSKTARD